MEIAVDNSRLQWEYGWLPPRTAFYLLLLYFIDITYHVSAKPTSGKDQNPDVVFINEKESMQCLIGTGLGRSDFIVYWTV